MEPKTVLNTNRDVFSIIEAANVAAQKEKINQSKNKVSQMVTEMNNNDYDKLLISIYR